MARQIEQHAGTPDDPLTRVFTVSNAITFARLCMIPAFFVELVGGNNVAACVLFALAAGTDWFDGQIARRTNTVSVLGRMLDPCVDRLLMIFGVIGVFIVGRIPLWIILLVLIRDIGMIAGYSYLLKRWGIRIDVIYPGKVCTTLFFIGFAALLLNFPPLVGLGLTDLSWLPGFNGEIYSWGIWFIYAGLVLCVYTTGYYIRTALARLDDARNGSERR
ncbi:CDP-alcohol phosphatidyltransferase family protein [Curtanaerobium respiraculi]|uniref:CDP-alcohol phosphatidyltransferase family protein n=1 Tax=Curtanaerobium respiraculi TaxID=2949669 RepID=UPI0024B3AA6C|nr:CDP-alcohol phosphatidyltransferase family protein [Curtanaerobium respiraculi]